LELPTRSIGREDWDALSAESKIKWLLGDGDEKWGWVVYRSAYAPALADSQWEDFKRRLEERTPRAVAQSDAPDIADRLDWVFVEDLALDGASLAELKHHFHTWARAECPGWDVGGAGSGRGSRYTYFVRFDADGLLNGEVNLVRGCEGEEAAEEMGDDGDGNEDWMRIRESMLAPGFYVEMDNDESWYAHHRPPRQGVVKW